MQRRNRAIRKKRKAKIIDMEIAKAMRTIYEDKKLMLLYHRGAWTPTAIQNMLSLRHVHYLHEIWVYNPMDLKFLAYKNKGDRELLGRLAKSGIKVKTTAAKIPTAAAQQLAFVADEDHFLFKLKYGL